MSSTDEPTETELSIDVLSRDARMARVNVGIDGDPIGVMVFLAAEELAMLGVDVGANNSVTYWIENGQLLFE